jgi:hypothetical protein
VGVFAHAGGALTAPAPQALLSGFLFKKNRIMPQHT